MKTFALHFASQSIKPDLTMELQTTFTVKELKAYSMKELCQIYQVSDKTMRKWLRPFLDEIGPRHGHLYTVAQVRIIFKHLGIPCNIG